MNYMDIKLKTAEEFLEKIGYKGKIPLNLFEEVYKNLLKETVEKTLQIASQNADADIYFKGWLAEQEPFAEGEDYEVYVINSSILNLKEVIFKENNL